MQEITDFLLPIVQNINKYLSGYILTISLLGCGLFFTIKTRFVQVRCFGEGIKEVFGGLFKKKKDNEGGLSSFQALATAIAAQVGTGNLVGACSALLTGGPGAIFWMWIAAFFGMSTIYAEATLAQKTREVKSDGTVVGGPVYYIKKAFPNKLGKFLAAFFAIAITLALGFIGSMVQANAISNTFSNAFPVIPTWVVGVVLVVLCGIIFIGGIKRIANVAEKLVPIMAVLFLVGSFTVLIINIKALPETFKLIFVGAFNPQAALGGVIGITIKEAISKGVGRGLFSNEAVMGSTPHAHALADVKTPHKQGVVAMIGVFIDTFVVLTMTSLVVISTLYTNNGPLCAGRVAGFDENNMVQKAFGLSLNNETAGNIFVAICLLFFAFTTILSWNYFGKINTEYLFGKKSNVPYSIIALIFIFLGTVVAKSELVWELSDTFNQLMVIPNVLALFALSKLVKDSAMGKDKLKQVSKKELNKTK